MEQPDVRIPVHHPHTASRVYGGEAPIISPAENVVRMLNPVGSRIWELADGSRTIEQIATVLTAEYEVDLPQARASVAAFVEALVAKELMTWA